MWSRNLAAVVTILRVWFCNLQFCMLLCFAVVFDLRSANEAGKLWKWEWNKKPIRDGTQTHFRINTHTRLTALFPRLPRWAGTIKVKPIWILLKQETVSGSGIIWTICKSAPRSRQITTPAPHHSSFLQAGCPSCRPTNSVKALKASLWNQHSPIICN